MQISLPLSSLFIIAIDSVGVLIAMLTGTLLVRKVSVPGHKPQFFLGLLLILASLTLLNDLLNTSGLTSRFQDLYFLPIYFSFAIGPLLYLFVKAKLGKLDLAGADWKHLLLPSLQFLIYLSIGFRSSSFKSAIWNTELFRLYLSAESVIFPALLIIYALLAKRLIESQNLALFWSADIQRWLRQFIRGVLWLAGAECLYFLSEVAFTAFGGSFTIPIIIHSLILSSMLLWIALNGFKLYTPALIHQSRYQHPDEKQTNHQGVAQKIERLMQQERLYLNPALNLELLAHLVGESPKVTSQTINGVFKQNFNNYINGYRVAAVQHRIQAGDHRKLTLTAIAFECGFDSKSTFNRVFKLVTQKTPSEFIAEQQS